MNNSYLKLFVDCLEKYQKLNDTEFGRLVRAALRYKATGAEPTDLGREALLWDGMRLDIDRDNESYAEAVRIRSEAGRAGAAARWGGHKSQDKNAIAINRISQNGKHGQEKEKEKDKDKDKDKDQDKEGKSARAPRGQYGWVRLSDDEYSRLLADLGETELARCIAYVDESAQSSGNKNHWRDWNLVVRRCHRDGWGLNTKSPPKSMQPGTDTNPTPERIKANADWLDEFLAEQEAGE